jgi:O-antigen/teichoic acid export membrane protein
LSLNSISVGVSLVLGIFSTKLVSMFLGTAGMALIGSLRNFTTMLKSLATLGINNSIVTLFVENKTDQKALATIYATFFWIFLFISVVLSLFVFLFAGLISTFLFYSDSYVLPIEIFALSLPLIVLNTFWMAIYNGLEFFRKIIFIQIISNIAAFVITFIFVWKGNIQGGLLSVAVSEAVMVFVTYLFVRRNNEYFRFELKRIVSKKYVGVIRDFSAMALLSAVIVPLTLILIRNQVIKSHSMGEAGIWEGVIRLSGFYMLFFNSGLSLYYMPKLASLKTDSEFLVEVKSYFKLLVPLFAAMLVMIYFLRGLIVDIAFTAEFHEIKNILAWQLAGDFFRVMTLAFGYQIVVKTMMKEYFLVEFSYNLIYLSLSFWFLQTMPAEGVVKAYFFSNIACMIVILFVFRKLFLPKKA